MLSETGTRIRGYKIVSMLSSAEHEIFHSQMVSYGHFNIFEWEKCWISWCFILTSFYNFMLRCVEHKIF